MMTASELFMAFPLFHAPVETGTGHDEFLTAQMLRAAGNVAPRMIGAPVVRVGQYGRKPRGLRTGQPVRGRAEIGLRSGLGAVIAVAPVDEIEIGGEDALFWP